MLINSLVTELVAGLRAGARYPTCDRAKPKLPNIETNMVIERSPIIIKYVGVDTELRIRMTNANPRMKWVAETPVRSIRNDKVPAATNGRAMPGGLPRTRRRAKPIVITKKTAKNAAVARNENVMPPTTGLETG